MNQIRKHIISVFKVYRIIGKCCCVQFHRRTGQHFNQCSLQPVKIHINQWNNCFIRACLRPVTSEFTFLHYTNHCFRIINCCIFQQISIIPSLYFLKIFLVCFAQLFYFIFCKPNIRCKITGLQHCKLIKIIQCRLCLLFFDRQNSCQISQLNILCWLSSFKHAL